MTAANVSAREKEFELSDREFAYICRLIGREAGIVLTSAKREMVYGRLVRRLRTLELSNFRDYCKLLEKDDGNELGYLINALTTNLTSFFRESHHFEFLADTIVKSRTDPKNIADRRIRIWSAACSSGEEPYSIAMTMAESLPQGWSCSILASDLDTDMLARAKAGIYPMDRLDKIDSSRVKRFFLRGKAENAGKVRVRPEIRNMITFEQINLIADWPRHEPFDVIFCRNVVIYFDKATQRRIFEKFADIMMPDGYLFIGHSESLFKVTERFELIGNTIYQRKK